MLNLDHYPTGIIVALSAFGRMHLTGQPSMYVANQITSKIGRMAEMDLFRHCSLVRLKIKATV